MEQRIEREWKSVLCPNKEERTWVMCEWDIVSERGQILRRRLRRIDCLNPKLNEFGGADCDWACQEVFAKREK